MTETECKHERRHETSRVDQRLTGPVRTVTVKCANCGKVIETWAVKA